MPRQTNRPGRRVAPGGEQESAEPRRSPTAVAAEAAELGIVPGSAPAKEPEIPGEDAALRAGDPDVAAIDAGMVGDATPGGSTPTPDQSVVDEIGHAMGISEIESGELRSTAEVLEARDRRRSRTEPTPERDDRPRSGEVEEPMGPDATGAREAPDETGVE
jgi:Family of unknown function (DUF6335)